MSGTSDSLNWLNRGGLDGRGLAFGQEKHYEKYETLAERQDVSSTTLSQVTSSTTSSQDTSSTTSSPATIATSAVISNDLGEGSTFFIPTKSNNPWQQNITDVYSMYDSSTMVFSIHYNANFVANGNGKIVDFSSPTNTNFTACVIQCAKYNEAYENPGSGPGCEGVSWVDNYCYLKYGPGLTENVTFTTRTDAISALKHFLTPLK